MVGISYSSMSIPAKLWLKVQMCYEPYIRLWNTSQQWAALVWQPRTCGQVSRCKFQHFFISKVPLKSVNALQHYFLLSQRLPASHIEAGKDQEWPAGSGRNTGKGEQEARQHRVLSAGKSDGLASMTTLHSCCMRNQLPRGMCRLEVRLCLTHNWT